MTQYDKNNVPLFEKGIDNHYLCRCCGQYTTLHDSVSHKGYNLVCNRCYYKLRLSILGRDILNDIQAIGKQREEEERSKTSEDE